MKRYMTDFNRGDIAPCFKVTTDTTAEGLIEQSIDLAGTMQKRVMNTAESQIRNALIALGWIPPVAVDGELYSQFENGERQALLQVRSFITKHGAKEVDAFCAQRLHDIMMDARPRPPKAD